MNQEINEQNQSVGQNQSEEQEQNQSRQNQSRQNQSRQNQYSELEDDDIDELALLGTNQNELRSYKEAIKSTDWPNWQTAMGIEMDQLKKQKTWDLVDLPPNRKALKIRWVYKIKYKARWVVKGFS